jgi:hypothetical protein
MTATNIYFSTDTPNFDRSYSAVTSNATGGSSGSLNSGTSVGVTSVRAADFLELRIMVYTTGTTKTNVTKKDVETFLELCKRWLHDNTGNRATTNDGQSSGQGLDFVISNDSIAAGIP